MEKGPTLDDELMAILGTENVYFQPPESLELDYPCIVYSKAGIRTQSANNKHYIFNQRYDVTVIYEDPDEDISMRLLEHFSQISFGRTFVSDNLYHDTLTLYYK